jgi:hypothetical protein
MGAEYKSETFEQIAELGVTVINLPPYRPELKGRVEKFFDLIQSSYKGYLKGKGVIESDFQERGVHDYRKDACLTMYDFEKIILHCILYYNNHRILKGFVMSKDMLNAHVEPYSSSIWKWGKAQAGANLISVSYEDLVLTLLPRTIAKFTRNGLMVNKLRYKNEEYTEQYLQGGTVTVGYNPDDVSCVWLKDDEIYKVFTLVETAYKGFKQEEVDLIKESQKSRERALKCQNIQAKIDLAEHIKTIASVSVKRGNTSIKRVRKTRSAEQRKNHVDFVKGGMLEYKDYQSNIIERKK